MGVCCCSNSVLNMVVMGLALGQSLMVTSTPVIMQKYLPFIIYCEVCCGLHVKQIVYKLLNI